jgi:hypothetical protein
MTKNDLQLYVFVPMFQGLPETPSIFLARSVAEAAFKEFTDHDYKTFMRTVTRTGQTPKTWNGEHDGTIIQQIGLHINGLSDDKCNCKKSHHTHADSGFCDMCLGWCI